MDKRPFSGIHYALIAAGEGSRLREEGIKAPKPLVEIQGLPMIERLICIFLRNGARSISVICNEQMTEVQEFLENLRDSDLMHVKDAEGTAFVCPLNIVVQSTPSSMHSLASLADVIPEGRFCLTTVDTIFTESEFTSFIRTFATMEDSACDGLFAVTPFVDDEKPLWVGVRADVNSLSRMCGCVRRVEGFYDKECDVPASAVKCVSGGIYCLDTRTAFPVLHDCLEKGQSRMRNYQRALIAAGLKINAYTFPKIMDIDHASDIEKAEAWLASKRLLSIARDVMYSPNNEAKDAAIFSATLDNLRAQGWQIESCSEAEWNGMDVKSVTESYGGIIHMARKMRSLMRLERVRIPVVNAPQSVRTVAKSREMTLTLLQQAGVSVPQWWAYEPEEDEMFMCEPQLQLLLPGWVKAMREEGAKAEDVCYVDSPLEADARILQFAAENVPDIVVTKHVDGELIKCYAVQTDEEMSFFHWFRPQQMNYSKFGEAEHHNRQMTDFNVDEASLRLLAMKIGQALGLQIFGFDAIVQADGTLTVIDVNDWPSFSVCRDEAAEAIATMITKTITRK